MAITFETPVQALNIYTNITDAASAPYDMTVTRGLVVSDAWLQVTGAASGAGANTAQLQTAAGATNVTATIGFNNQPRGTIVRTTTVLSANSTFAAAAVLRYNIVRGLAPNGAAVNIVAVPA